MYQPPASPVMTPHLGRTGLRYGIPTGLALGVIESLAVVYLSHPDGYYSYSILIVPFSLLLWIVIFLLIGTLAGKRSGKIIAGMLAALWAALVGGFITAVTIFAMLVPFAPYPYNLSNVALSLTFIIVLLLGTLGVGTGLGALGGLIGQSFSAKIKLPVYQRPKSDSPQVHYNAYRESDLPQLEQEQVQYQRRGDFPRQD